MVAGLSLALIALVGCKQEAAVAPLYEVFGEIAVGAQVGAAVGVGAVEIPVRVINERGAAVAGGAVSVRAVGLEITEQTLQPDGLGVATLSLSGPPQAIEVEITEASGGDGSPAESWILGGDPQALALGWLPVLPQTLVVERAVAAEGGVGLITDDQVWWQPATPGAPAQHMVSLSGPIRGAWALDIDADGLRDLALWSDDELVLLRGHASAGYVWGWGAALADGAALQWLGVGDADGDSLRDLVLLLERDGTQLIQVLGGDGVWGFRELEPLYPELALRSVAAGWFSAEGPASVLVLTDDYRLRQYALRDGWSLVGGDLSPALPVDATLATARDLTGDGVDEALVLQPPVELGDRQLTIINYGSGPTQFSVKYSAFHAGFADLDGDRIDDILIAEGGAAPRLGYISVKSDGYSFVFNTLSELDEAGPVAAGDFDGDQIADVAVQAGDLRIFPGATDPETGGWRVASGVTSAWNLDALGPMAVGDVDDDGRAEVGVLRLRDGRAALSVLDFSDEADGSLQLTTAARADVDFMDEGNTASALDIALCVEGLYAIVQDGGERYLFGVPVDQGEAEPFVVGPVDADRVTCGDFGGSAAVATGGAGASEIQLYDAQLGAIQSQPGSPGDLAASGPLGAQGLATCEGDCTVESEDLDGDGEDEILEGSADGGVLSGWGGVWSLGAPGQASFIDLDDDGWADSALTDTSTQQIAVSPTLSGAPGPVTLWRWDAALSGPVMFGDVDGDGRAEALVAGANGQLLHSDPAR